MIPAIQCVAMAGEGQVRGEERGEGDRIQVNPLPSHPLPSHLADKWRRGIQETPYDRRWNHTCYCVSFCVQPAAFRQISTHAHATRVLQGTRDTHPASSPVADTLSTTTCVAVYISLPAAASCNAASAMLSCAATPPPPLPPPPPPR